MKKSYIAPSVNVYKVHLSQVIAASLQNGGTGKSGDIGEVKEESDWDMWSNYDEQLDK